MRINLGNNSVFFWNPGILSRAVNEAFEEVVNGLGEEFKKVIQDENAFPDNFPGRDIVDTGALLANQKIEIKAPGVAEYNWGVDYAIYVHEGYTLRNGRRQPARPWTRVAIKRYNPQLKFALFVAKNILTIRI